jgi:signal transduction histidine kinase
MDDQELVLPQPVARELARITQEALVNVRKHSGAAHVMVQLLESNGSWELIVEDDGAGFPFTGRISHPELETTPHVPAIIRERVRIIEGQLTIDSRPGRGSRVEVRVALNRQAAHG